MAERHFRIGKVVKKNLEFLFNPKSVAIIGASNKYDRISGRPLKFFLKHGYQGKIFPVNPKHRSLLDIKCYPDIAQIPDVIELVIITLPSKYVLDVLQACIKKGVKTVVIFSSGFAEIGREGRKLQHALKEMITNSDTIVLGPNCLGFVNLHDRISATFGGCLEYDDKPLAGNVGLLSQSGALSNIYFAVAQARKIGFSYWIATGNEVDIDFADCLEYLLQDEKTKIIVCIIEGLSDGKKFLRIAQKGIEAKKPILTLKVGKSRMGGKASLSHTGAIAGSDAIYEEAFRKAGMLRCDSVEEIIDSLPLFTQCSLPQGNRIGIVTTTGGGGILMADKCEELGLEVPELKNAEKREIVRVIPQFGSALNPIDVTGQVIDDVKSIKNSAQIMLNCEYIDRVVLFLGMLKNYADKIVKDILALYQQSQKPLCVTWVDPPEGAIRILSEGGIPAFDDPVRCLKALSIHVRYTENIRRRCLQSIHTQERKTVKENALGRGRKVNQALALFASEDKVLAENEAKKILKLYDVPVTKENLSKSRDEAVAIATKIGFPVVLKIASPHLPHKTEMDGIKLNVQTADEVQQCYEEMMSTIAKKHNANFNIQGILVQEMIFGAYEVFIGVKQDRIFGPTVMFGMGGIYTEIFNDHSIRIVPFTRNEAHEMVAEIRGIEILKGLRGKAQADIPSIVDTLLKVSQLASDLEDRIQEIDINPLFVFAEGKGVKAGDALMVLR